MSKKSVALLAMLGVASAAGTAYAIRRFTEAGDRAHVRASIPPQTGERFTTEWDAAPDSEPSDEVAPAEETPTNAG